MRLSSFALLGLYATNQVILNNNSFLCGFLSLTRLFPVLSVSYNHFLPVVLSPRDFFALLSVFGYADATAPH